MGVQGKVLRQCLGVGAAIDRAGRGEHNAIAAGIAHGLEQRQRALHVVDVVFLRVRDRLSNQAGRREMHHSRNLVLGKGVRQCCLVQQITGDNRTRDEAAMSGGEVVIDNGLITRRG